jgi:hypothetical protein
MPCRIEPQCGDVARVAGCPDAGRLVQVLGARQRLVALVSVDVEEAPDLDRLFDEGEQAVRARVGDAGELDSQTSSSLRPTERRTYAPRRKALQIGLFLMRNDCVVVRTRAEVGAGFRSCSAPAATVAWLTSAWPGRPPWDSEARGRKRHDLYFWCPTEPVSRGLGAKALEIGAFQGHQHRGSKRAPKGAIRRQRGGLAESTDELAPW